MAVTARERRKTAYRNSVYVQGNTAVRRNEHQLYAMPQEVPAQKKQISTRTRKNREKALYMNIGYIMFMTVAMLAAGVILTWYLNIRSDIATSINNIAKLESQLNDLRLDNDENYDNVIKTLKKIFDERLELCHRALKIRHKRLSKVTSDVAPILWQHGALARLKKGETIDGLLKSCFSTISFIKAALSVAHL